MEFEDRLVATMFGVKKKLFIEIMYDEILRERIFNEFIIGVEEGDSRPAKTLAEIAEQLLPDSFSKNETVAREMIAWVGRAVYEQKVRSALDEIPYESLEMKEEDIEKRVKSFNDARNEKIYQQKGEKDADRFALIRIKGNIAQGANIYSEDFVRRFIELEKIYIYPEGHSHVGKPNLVYITTILGEEFSEYELTTKKIYDFKRKNPLYNQLTNSEEF